MGVQFTVKEIEKALVKHKGNFSAAAREVGCTRATINRRVGESVTLREKVSEIRESLKDRAEQNIFYVIHEYEEIQDEDGVPRPVPTDRAIETSKWLLRNLAGERGWGDKIDVTKKIEGEVKHSGNINLELTSTERRLLIQLLEVAEYEERETDALEKGASEEAISSGREKD